MKTTDKNCELRTTNTPANSHALRTPKYIQDMCEDAVSDMNRIHRLESLMPSARLFSVAGPLKVVSAFSSWFARITSGMTILEASAVLSTNPLLQARVKDLFPSVNITFSKVELQKSCN